VEAICWHQSSSIVAAAPDWLAAQSGHKPHGVTVMGANRRAPSQAGSDARSPRLASPQSLQNRVSISIQLFRTSRYSYTSDMRRHAVDGAIEPDLLGRSIAHI
jgi:hypothetical protein